MKPALYRRRPIIVEALKFEYSVEGIASLKAFVGDSLGVVKKGRAPSSVGEAEILTLEDGVDRRCKHIATEGDYIIKGVNGEFWPVKPDIFKSSYEHVE